MAQVAGAPLPAAAKQPPPPGPPGLPQRPQPPSGPPRPRQPSQQQQPYPPAARPSNQQQQQHRPHHHQHGRPPGASSNAAAAAGRHHHRGAPPGRPSAAGSGPGRHGAAAAGAGAGGGNISAAAAAAAAAAAGVHVPAVAADCTAELEQLRRLTPFQCSIRFRNDLPEISSDPKLVVSRFEPERLSKFFVTSIEQQPRRELLLPADVGVPISLLDLERYDVPAGQGMRPKLDPADEALLQDVDNLPAVGGAAASPLKVKRATKGAAVSWLMATTYLTSGADAPKRGGPGSSGRFQMGSSQQTEELTREQQLADIEATFTAAAGVPRHPTKRNVTAVRSVPILPDLEAWADKYVTVTFEEGDPGHDSKTLSKVKDPELRKALMSHCMIKSYAPGGGATPEPAMGLLVPQATAAAVVNEGAPPPDSCPPEDLQGDYGWECEYSFDLLQRDVDKAPQTLLLVMNDDNVGYCQFDGQLKLKKRKRQPGDEPRPQKAMIQHRGYNEGELAERASRVAELNAYGGEGMAEGDVGQEDIFGDAGDEGMQEDAEDAEQGGLGYQ